MYVSICFIYGGFSKGQERMSDLLEMELQTTVSHLLWVQRTEFFPDLLDHLPSSSFLFFRRNSYWLFGG